MKITVITNKDGKLAAAAYGHNPQPNTSEVQPMDYRAGIMAGPEQKLHVLDVPDDINHQEFHARIESELQKIRK